MMTKSSSTGKSNKGVPHRSYSSFLLSLLYLLSIFSIGNSRNIDNELNQNNNLRNLDESYSISSVPLSWSKSGTLTTVLRSFLPNSNTCFTPLSSIQIDNVLLLIGSMIDTPLNNKSPLCNNTLTWKMIPKINSIQGTVFRSWDDGQNWEYVNTFTNLARYGSAVFNYNALQDSDVLDGLYSSNAINCRLICLAGGNAIDTTNTFYEISYDVICSSDYGDNWLTLTDNALPYTLFGASGAQVNNLGVWLVGGLLDDSSDSKIPFLQATIDPDICTIDSWNMAPSLDDYLPGGPRAGMMITYAPSREQLIVGGGWKLSSVSSSSSSLVSYIVTNTRTPYTDLWTTDLSFSGGWGNSGFGTKWRQLTYSFPIGYSLSCSVTGAQIWEFPKKL